MSLHNDYALVVALDTSTDMLACAASWTDGQTGEAKLVSGDHMCRRHANVELVNTFDSVLAQAGMDRADVGSYVVGRGPGSFTGVRIGISTAKGLARGANVPLLGVSTLDACAWTAWKAGVRGKLGILADAMRGEVYPALYVLGDEGPERQFEREHVVKAAVALDEWRQAADWDQVQLTGDGLVRYGKLLGEDEVARCVERGLWWPSGEGLLLAHAAGDGDPARVLPIYTRLSDAEENERKRLGLARARRAKLRASPMSSPVAICNSAPWVRRTPRVRARWRLPALKALGTRRGRRACFYPSWARMLRRRAAGGWRTTTVSCWALPAAWS